MTAPTTDTTVAPVPPTSRVARMRARCAALIGPWRAWAWGGPRWRRWAIAAGLVTIIGLMGGLTLLALVPARQETPISLDEALQALDAGDFDTARKLALRLQAEGLLTYDQRGGPAYIQGHIARHAAANAPYPEEQRQLYLVAARYLSIAYHDNFAPAISPEGIIALGECWHHAGRYARALPYLTEALKRRPRNAAQIHRLLAACYYRDTNPQLRPALAHIEKYLADRLLAPAEREAGLVERARIQIDLGDIAAAEETLARVPGESPHASAVNLLRGRLLMRRAAELAMRAETGADAAEESASLWRQAIELLRSPLPRDEASAQAQREAQYLLGLCYIQTDDYRAAENQFSRTRRLNLGLPEGRAAALEEADLQRRMGKDEAAIELYRDLLRELGDLRDYSNPWLPLDQLRQRLLDAYRHYRDGEKYEVALQFVTALTPLLTQPRTIELKAELNRLWAERLAAAAVGLDPAAAAPLARDSRVRYHRAAELYYRLARLSQATREYPEYLWASAECYQRAHDFHRTSRVMRMYLDQHQPQRRADALLAIGESELALNNLEAALEALLELLRDDSRHPLSYRARLVAHRVYLERHDQAAARKMLQENLEHEALTPQSVEWRDSLFALAGLLYREGLEQEARSRQLGVDSELDEERRAGLKALEQAAATFQEAILKFREALSRYPDHPSALESRYLLAECYRQAAKWPRKRMPTISIETTRAALTRQMREELLAAQELYAGLINDLNSLQDQQPLTEREQELLRNCYFLQADALFDLERYREAIGAYSSATNRYQQRPEALEAFVQIASCYRHLEEPAKARGTLEQAKVVLRRIPADADFDKTTRYNRDEWIELLDFLSSL